LRALRASARPAFAIRAFAIRAFAIRAFAIRAFAIRAFAIRAFAVAVLAVAGLAVASLAVASLAPARAQPGAAHASGATVLQVLNQAPLRFEPLTASDYARGYSRPLSVDVSVLRCRPGPPGPHPEGCSVEIFGILPFDGLDLDDVQWSTQPGGPWTDLGPDPATVFTVPGGIRQATARIFLRTRIDPGSTPARPVDARSLIRLRLVH
jgi:hypothetical protein